MQQYQKFAQYLNQVITQAGLHKNEMIRNLGIDRSSYFQILKGNRLPTREQYQNLKQLLLLPKEENIVLDDLYYRAILGEDTWDNIRHVSGFIKVLSESEKPRPVNAVSPVSFTMQNSRPEIIRFLQGREGVQAGIEEILYAALSEKKLDFFMPASADIFYDLLRQMIPRVTADCTIRQLTGLPGGRIADRTEAISVFQGLLAYLSARTNIHLECRYYYNSVSNISDIGLLYPWYVICGNNVLIISSDFRNAVFSKDTEFASAYSAQFEQAYGESTPMLKNYGLLEQNLRTIREFLKGKQEVNYEALPCIAMIATPDKIRKYVIPQAQEELIAHCEQLQRDETMIDISSFSGLRYFLKVRKIPEIPDAYMKEIDLQDLLWYTDILLERLGTTLHMIDETRIPAAYDWDITIIEDTSVLIHHHNFDTIIIDEKNIVDIFTSFAQHIAETPYIMDDEKARKELLDIRSELMMQLQKESQM